MFLSFEKYEQVLLNKKHNEPVVKSRIQSNKHVLWTETETKKSLRFADDKRYILEDGIRTTPLGYYKNVVKRQRKNI